MGVSKSNQYRNYRNYINDVYSGEAPTTELMLKHGVGSSFKKALVDLKLISRAGQNGIWIGKAPNGEMIDQILYYVKSHSRKLNLTYPKKRKQTNQLSLPTTQVDPLPPNQPEAEERFTWGEWLERLKNNPIYEYRLTRVKRSTEPEVLL